MQRVVVTGAAGGIGKAVVESFIEAGCSVLGVDSKESVLGLVESDRYKGVVADVTDPAQLEEAANMTPSVSHLVIVAGGAVTGETTEPLVSCEVWNASLLVDLSAAYYSIHAFERCLARTEGDRSVTLISSINAVQGYGLAAYSAAKAGMSGLANALIGPFGEAGIRVNAVLPGTVPTERTLNEWSVKPGHFEEMAAGVPLGKLGVPADVARAVRALALDLTHVHGAELVVDGGQSKSR